LNIFDFLVMIPNRSFLNKTDDLDNINVILNCSDASEHLKISPNGLEVRKSILE